MEANPRIFPMRHPPKYDVPTTPPFVIWDPERARSALCTAMLKVILCASRTARAKRNAFHARSSCEARALRCSAIPVHTLHEFCMLPILFPQLGNLRCCHVAQEGCNPSAVAGVQEYTTRALFLSCLLNLGDATPASAGSLT